MVGVIIIILFIIEKDDSRSKAAAAAAAMIHHDGWFDRAFDRRSSSKRSKPHSRGTDLYAVTLFLNH